MASFCTREPQVPGEKGKPVTTLITVSKADHNTTRELEVGENFEIRLPENPTTGYTWAAVKIPEGLLRSESESFEAETADPRIVGRGGTKVMVFKALRAGSGELELRLRRPWEKEAFIDSFVLKITIKGNH